jgi:hypothetical protein
MSLGLLGLVVVTVVPFVGHDEQARHRALHGGTAVT